MVGELARKIDENIRRCAGDFGLTPSQAIDLRELNAPMTMRELASRVGCEPSNVTFVIDKLEKQGLVTRRPHPTDRRAKELVLTEAGVDVRTRMMEALKHDSPLGGLTVAEQRNLQVLLLRAMERPED
jgi:DNA-binding MarR family transcriptional regulator